MTAQELILKDPKEIRKSESLMDLYIQIFQETFNRKPDCAGCTFKNDFSKLVTALKIGIQKTETMSKNSGKTFKLKKGFADKILSFKKGQRTFRTYGRDASDDFVNEFITEGSEAQIAQRKEMFETLPTGSEDSKSDSKSDVKSDGPILSKLNKKQLAEYAASNNLEIDTTKTNKEQVAQIEELMKAKVSQINVVDSVKVEDTTAKDETPAAPEAGEAKSETPAAPAADNKDEDIL